MKKLMAVAAASMFMVSACCQKEEKTAVAVKSNAEIAIENIMTRSSVRAYTSQKPSEGQIDTILRAAFAAPTGMNRQPWAFVVVDDRALLDTMAGFLPGAPMLEESQVAIVVCGDLLLAPKDVAGHNYWEQDCSAATENLLLATHALGLGAVWTGVFPSPEKVAFVQSVLQMPENLIPLAVMPIGYPDEPQKIKDKWDANKVYYNTCVR
ncbi:MAG: nitroreductase family protein [Rikenellaceae bacterium]